MIGERLMIQLFLMECKEDSGILLPNSKGSILILIFSKFDSIGQMESLGRSFSLLEVSKFELFGHWEYSY